MDKVRSEAEAGESEMMGASHRSLDRKEKGPCHAV